jgi:hypothetical protein
MAEKAPTLAVLQDQASVDFIVRTEKEFKDAATT